MRVSTVVSKDNAGMKQATIRHVTVAEVESAQGIDALIAEYAKESAIAGMPYVCTRFDIYRAIEAGARMRAFGAFVDDTLVGFIVFSVVMMPNYGIEVGCQHVFFVADAYRKTGAGLRLLRAAEREAHDMGAAGFLSGCPIHSRLAMVMPEIGYMPADTIFFKVLK